MKKFLSVILALSLLMSVFAMSVSAEGERPLGDADGDGTVSVTDALLTLQAAVFKISFDEAQTLSADVNADGEISVNDALLIIQYAVNKIALFPCEDGFDYWADYVKEYGEYMSDTDCYAVGEIISENNDVVYMSIYSVKDDAFGFSVYYVSDNVIVAFTADRNRKMEYRVCDADETWYIGGTVDDAATFTWAGNLNPSEFSGEELNNPDSIEAARDEIATLFDLTQSYLSYYGRISLKYLGFKQYNY